MTIFKLWCFIQFFGGSKVRSLENENDGVAEIISAPQRESNKGRELETGLDRDELHAKNAFSFMQASKCSQKRKLLGAPVITTHDLSSSSVSFG